MTNNRIVVIAFIFAGCMWVCQASDAQQQPESILRQPPIVKLVSERSSTEYFQDEQAPADQETPDVDDLPEWPVKSIREINVDPRDQSGDVPEDRSSAVYENDPGIHGGAAAGFHVQWVAPNIRYRPLYFEDVPLERYGQVDWGRFQYLKSSNRMLGNAVLLPVNAMLDPPRRCDHPLGFERPGNCVPQSYQRLFHPRRPSR